MDDQIGWHDFFYDLDNGGIDDFISKHKIADENFRQFLNNIPESVSLATNYFLQPHIIPALIRCFPGLVFSPVR